MATVKLPHGSVRFKVKQLPGCCGVAVVYHPVFTIKLPGEGSLKMADMEFIHDYRTIAKATQVFNQLFKEFNSYIKEGVNIPFDLYRSKILMTDFIGGAVYKFCTHNKWSKSKGFINYKTAETLHIFTLNAHRVGPG